MISTQVEQQGLGHFEEAVVSAQNARRLARLCLSYSNRWLEAFENTHRTCAESLTLRGIKFQAPHAIDAILAP